MENVTKATATEFDDHGGFRGFGKLPSFAGDLREHGIVSPQLQTNKEEDPGGFEDFKYAFKEFIWSAIVHDKLSRGLMKTIEALEGKEALMCILAENCDEVEYKKQIQDLCQEHSIPLVIVPDNMRLGRIAAFRMLDSEGNKIKGVPCHSMIVHSHDWKWSTDKGAFIIEWVLKKKPTLELLP